MGQLLQNSACPTCGKPMEMALPLGGKGPRVLACIDCNRADPLTDKTSLGWLKGELGRQSDPAA